MKNTFLFNVKLFVSPFTATCNLVMINIFYPQKSLFHALNFNSMCSHLVYEQTHGHRTGSLLTQEGLMSRQDSLCRCRCMARQAFCPATCLHAIISLLPPYHSVFPSLFTHLNHLDIFLFQSKTTVGILL